MIKSTNTSLFILLNSQIKITLNIGSVQEKMMIVLYADTYLYLAYAGQKNSIFILGTLIVGYAAFYMYLCYAYQNRK